jgi:arylsulfatase A-like enzyme
MDLAVTFAALAGVSALDAEGLDLTPLLTDRAAAFRHDLLIEHLHDTPWEPIPTYCAVRDDGLQPEGYLYVLNGTAEEELYDLKNDFYELTNVAADPSYVGQLAALRTVAQQLCQPPPPGFHWPPGFERPSRVRRS